VPVVVDERFVERLARNAIVEVGGCLNGELVVPIGAAGDVGRRTVLQVARQFGDDQHPDAISLWDISRTRLVRVPRDTPVNVCDDVVVAYAVRQEASQAVQEAGRRRRPRHGDLVAHDPLDIAEAQGEPR
jgi:hypothetical protein